VFLSFRKKSKQYKRTNTMKNKLLKLFVGAAALSVSLVASATEKANTSYVSVKGGAAFASKAKYDATGVNETNKSKAGAIGSLAFGHYFDALRVELEGNYEQHNLKTDTANNTYAKWNKMSVMANAYYDWEIADSFSLYAGLGLGLAHVDLKGKASPETTRGNFAFAYQLMAGMSYDITEAVAVTLGYRFAGATKAKLANNFKFKTPFSHSFEVGLRYSF